MTGFRTIARATALCGTLDIVYAAAVALMGDTTASDMLRGIASGPFGDAAKGWGLAGPALGLAVHFAIMAAMVSAGLILLAREPLTDISAWKTGTLYGLILYWIMYGAVLPMRFGVPFPNPDRVELAIDLFPHIAFVGIPLALIAGGRLIRRKPAIS